MIDLAKIDIKAGDGGNGCISFRHEKYVPKGGPDGGDGGKGGSVYLLTTEEKSTLLDFQYRVKFEAGNGKNGQGQKKSGKGGEDLIIKIPVGTLIREVPAEFKLRNLKSEQDYRVVADLSENNQQFMIAKGGHGGRGNDHFKSSTNQTPQIAEPGEKGEVKSLFLELKLIADVAIIGLPNAGKSTLLSRLTASQPKIASYPFTTLEPNLGVGEAAGRSFVLADIPGLIEGASEGKGLGHEFLRHIQRTKVIIHLVGLDQPGLRVQDYLDAIETINHELFAFDPKLQGKHQILVFNKIDLPYVNDNALEIERKLKRQGITVVGISAITGAGLEKLRREILLRLAKAEKEVKIEAARKKEVMPVFTAEDLLRKKGRMKKDSRV